MVLGAVVEKTTVQKPTAQQHYSTTALQHYSTTAQKNNMKKIITLLLLIFFQCALIFAQDNATTIALIGCHRQKKPAPVLSYFADEIKPQYCVWLGDNVYADTQTNAQHILKQLNKLAKKDGFQTLKENSKFYVTWDDHDLGFNNAGGKYPLKEESKAIHRTFWELEEEFSAEQSGVYYAGIEEQANGKKIQFIMLDGRYNRVKKGENADALGEAQWEWLKTELEKEADLRFIVSGYQVLLDKPTKWESWIKLGNSRERLFDLIKSTQAKGVVFLAGDQHHAEILKIEKALGYDAYEIMASGINQRPITIDKPNNRVAGPDRTLHSAPMVTVYWEGKDDLAPHLHFVLTDVETKKITLEYRIFLSDVGL